MTFLVGNEPNYWNVSCSNILVIVFQKLNVQSLQNCVVKMAFKTQGSLEIGKTDFEEEFRTVYTSLSLLFKIFIL